MNSDREDFERLCQTGHVFGPVEDLTIAAAEAELRVEFPDEYLELLRKYGAVLAGVLRSMGFPK
ncbi:MAG: hypothetical protein Q4G36_08960 [Paracoccus sp. (in: a-proteobacteria)]|nr:hypothetical protein [Paracoccus sp. (in: a-proteobacteria)]